MKRDVERTEKCLYCGYVSNDLDKIKEHEEYLHGCYRDINPRTPKSKKSKPKLKDSIWFANHLSLKGSDRKIDVLFEIYDDGNCKIFTDDLKYGNHLEIIYDKSIGMFNIKGINKLRDEYYRNLGKDVVTNVDCLEVFRDEVS